MKHYSDVDFAKVVGDKPGNIIVFKRILREKGVIGNRQQLTDTHIPVFKDAKKYKGETHSIWVDAFDHTIDAYITNGKFVVSETQSQDENNDVAELLKELTNAVVTMNTLLEKINNKL